MKLSSLPEVLCIHVGRSPSIRKQCTSYTIKVFVLCTIVSYMKLQNKRFNQGPSSGTCKITLQSTADISTTVCYFILLLQKSTLRIPNERRIYQLTGIVVYTRICSNSGHYSAFCRSLKDSTQWFHLNDTEVYREGLVLNLNPITLCLYFR